MIVDAQGRDVTTAKPDVEQPASVTTRGLAMSRREVTMSISALLSRFSNPEHEALPRLAADTRGANLIGKTGVLVTEKLGGQPEITQFAFFLPNTDAKFVRINWNLDTFNKAPKFYIINALSNLAKGMGAAAEHELEKLAGRFPS